MKHPPEPEPELELEPETATELVFPTEVLGSGASPAAAALKW